VTLVLVRHASAGDRREWAGDDRLRPLDGKGRRQAGRLPEVLAGVTVRRIVSSPYVRCVQTVEPLASALGLGVEPAPELGEERQHADGPALLAALLADDAVACVHGGIETTLGVHERFRKGAVWLFEEALESPVVLAER
jgi:8-oxo-dGTP diphosphatase